MMDLAYSFALAFAYVGVIVLVCVCWPERVGKGIVTRLLRRLLPARVAPPPGGPSPMLEYLIVWRVLLMGVVSITCVASGLSGWPPGIGVFVGSALLWVDDVLTGADWRRRFNRAVEAVKLGVSRLTDGIFVPEPST